MRTTDIDPTNKPTIRPVPELEVAAGRITRLAPRGPFVELRGIKRQLMTGDRIPVTLVFRAADGSKVTADTEALVRGISLRPVPGTAPAAPAPGATAAPPVAAPTTATPPVAAPTTTAPANAAPTTAAPPRPGG